MCRFLAYSVGQTLSGDGEGLKESVVGIEVFDRPIDYDPRIDPIVRVEARRLREKLRQYYSAEGTGDSIVIELPKGSYAPEFHRRGAPSQKPLTKAPRTVVVLPFTNLSGGGEGDYFSDGLTQELIHALSRIDGLRIIGWSSAARLRGQTAQSGYRVQADVAVEGSVRRQDNRVRVSVQLTSVATGEYIWTENFDRPVDDLFALQEEMAGAIARKFLAQWPRSGVDAPGRAYRVEAHDFYLKGRHEWFRRTPEAMRQSVALFERAIAIDGRCAPAWAGLSDAYSILADYGLEVPADVMPKARQAAQRALDIDPALAEAHASLAIVTSLYDWDWDTAGRHYRKSLELNPGYLSAHHWYGLDYLALLGRFDEAGKHVRIAIELDPLEPIVAEAPAYVALLRRDYSKAHDEYRRMTELYPHFSKSWTGLGRTLWAMGEFGGAVNMLEKGRELSGDLPSVLGALGQAYGCAGNAPKARRILARLNEIARRRHVSAISFAAVHLGLHEKHAALEWLEKGCERREPALVAIGVHPIYDELRGEPRFEALLKQVGLK
jgi:serine/threonine-protein kinase